MNGARTEVHPPKVERFDLAAMTNTDPKGFVRPVDRYQVEPWGLYMARPADHPRFDYLESWLLPFLGLRATVFHFTPGSERDQDFYLDIGDYRDEGGVWTSVDHYLDLIVRTGRDTELVDVDELLDARVAGHLDTATAQAAILRAAGAIDGLAAHRHDLGEWLDELAMPISWR